MKEKTIGSSEPGSKGKSFPSPPFDRIDTQYSRTRSRRPNRQQGQSLESLGHAIEYLVDSHLYDGEDRNRAGHDDAIRVLSSASTTVFLECSEVNPVHMQLKEWASRQLRSNPLLQLNSASEDQGIAHSRVFRFQTNKMKMVFRAAAFCMLTLDTFAYALEKVEARPVDAGTTHVTGRMQR